MNTENHLKESAEENTKIKKISISRSKSGLPTVGVGGGAYRNMFECRFIIRNESLAKAIFIKTSGHLACSLSQAIVPIRIGDILVEIDGRLPFVRDNPDIRIKTYLISDLTKEVDTEFAILKPIKFEIPDPVWNAVSKGIRYHNRDGSYFVQKMKKPICYWCGEELTFVPGKGWLHPDGKLYKTKIVNGEEVDDHCAMPIWK